MEKKKKEGHMKHVTANSTSNLALFIILRQITIITVVSSCHFNGLSGNWHSTSSRVSDWRLPATQGHEEKLSDSNHPVSLAHLSCFPKLTGIVPCGHLSVGGIRANKLDFLCGKTSKIL